MKKTKAINTLLPLLKLYPWAIPAVIILGTLSSLSEGLGISLFIPFLQSLDQATSQSVNEDSLIGFIEQLFIHIPPSSRLFIIPLCIFGSLLLKNCLSYGNWIVYARLNAHIGYHLRTSIFKQLLNVSYNFLDSVPSGKLLNTMGTEIWRTSEAIEVSINLITSACTIGVFATLLLLISWQMTLLVAVILILISVSIQRVTRQVKKLGQQAVEANDTLFNRAVEGLAGMRVIRAFGRESYEQERFECAAKDIRIKYIKLDVLSTAVGPLSEVLSVALLVCILIIALQNQFNLPTLLVFIFILYRLQPQVKVLDSARVRLAALTGAVEDILSLLDRSDKPYIRSGPIPFKGLKQAISFESVNFRYNPLEKLVFHNISIRIPRGKTTALVGPSGAGKSTLIDLICRFYDVTEGEIYVDDCPLRQLNLTSWRSRIAIVSQDVHIFNTTIRENIAYGRLDATQDEIIAAAKQAHADEFISQLPQGYGTKVGDRGIRLSGGQRQRIAMARAIIRNPEILILDEATNALDSVSEHLIQEAINTFSQNRTVIVIAHRLSTIKQADQIIVLQDGQIIEQGNLQQLLKLNGLFAKLYHLQYSSAQT